MTAFPQHHTGHPKKSIKTRIIWTISLLMLSGILFIATLASLQTYHLMKLQTESYFNNLTSTL